MSDVPRPSEVEERVVVYVTPYCGYCHMAKSLLRRRGQPYREIDVSGSPEARSWLVELTGQRTVPQVFIGGRSIGGFQELAALERGGELDKMLTP